MGMGWDMSLAASAGFVLFPWTLIGWEINIGTDRHFACRRSTNILARPSSLAPEVLLYDAHSIF
jgi:hypothetical protein